MKTDRTPVPEPAPTAVAIRTDLAPVPEPAGAPAGDGLLGALLLCYGGMACIAIAVNLPPVYLTTFAKTFGGEGELNTEQLGWIGSSIFIGLVAGLIVTGPLADRMGARCFVLLGTVLVGAGLAVMGLAPTYGVLLLGVFLMGLGAGMLDMVLSPIVAALQPHRKTSAMNWLHSFYAFGAVLTVLIGSLMLRWQVSWRLVCLAMIVGPGLIALGFVRARIPPLASETGTRTRVSALLASVVFLVTLLVMVLAGATELGMAQWLPAYAEKSLGYANWIGGMGLVAFYVAMWLGRSTAGVVSRHVRPVGLLVSCCVAAGALFLVASCAPWPGVALAACVVSGVAVSCMWPTLLGVTADRFPYGGVSMYALLAAAGNAGGIVMPWLVGRVANVYSLRWGLGSIAICPALMIVCLYWLNARREPHT